ncbi:VOC family protein [Blastopirellula marina]|uniref:VOC family protein n=1 Tax=Blastopirellula marina TaxID=124 RepID=UPI000323CE54|nr:VOC family protein [Blastopirellula marina]
MNADSILCNLIVLRSRNLDQAQAFYSALGLSFARHAHGNGPVHLASESGGQVFEIYPLANEAASTSSTRVGFCVPSVDKTYASLMSAGGTSVIPPKDSEWGRRAVVSDPDGHRIELTAK